MTQDEVLQTLRKVIAESDNFTTWTVSTPHLVELVKRAIEAERDACAKVCETLADDYYDCTGVANAITAAIRARGQA
jgi:predicted nucleic-acid-binding protein